MASLVARALSRFLRPTVAIRASTTSSIADTITSSIIASSLDFESNINEPHILESSLNENSFELVSNDISSVASFTKDDVLRQADFADQAYLSTQEVRATLADKEVHTFETYAAQGFVLARGKQVEIVFKGTSTLYDAVVTDLNGLPAFAEDDLLPHGGFLHAGFLAAFKTAWPQLLAILDKHCQRERLTSLTDLESMTIAGHSLGGALATVCALHLAHHMRSTSSTTTSAWSQFVPGGKLRVCTFGSPRVLSQQAAVYFNEVLGLGAHTLRVAQNDVDPVTMMAPGSAGFRHVGINLKVSLDARTHLPHVMSGYKEGVARLMASTFVPNHYVGMRKRVVHACSSILRLIL